MRDVEPTELLLGIGDSLHRYQEGFALGLIRVLVTNVRARFCWKQIDGTTIG